MTEEMPLLHAKGGELNIHNRHLDELRFFLKKRQQGMNIPCETDTMPLIC